MRGGAVYNRWTGNANKQKRQVGWHKGEEKMPFNCRTMDPLRATPSHAFTGLLTAWRSRSQCRVEFIIQEKIKRNSFSPIFQNLTKLVIFRLFSFRNVWRVAYIYKYLLPVRDIGNEIASRR